MFNFKRFVSFLLVFVLAMSCAAFADTPATIDARSATIKVTVKAYEIDAGKLVDDAVAASYSTTPVAGYVLEKSEQVDKDATWTIKAKTDTTEDWTTLDIKMAAKQNNDENYVIYVKDIAGLLTEDDLVSNITIRTEATVILPDDDREPLTVKAEDIVITVVNTKGNEPITDPADEDPDDDGDLDGDDETPGKAISVTVTTPAEVMDGDMIVLTITPNIPQAVIDALKIVPSEVQTRYYMSVDGGKGEYLGAFAGLDPEEGIQEAVNAVYGHTYYFWAVITAQPKVG